MAQIIARSLDLYNKNELFRIKKALYILSILGGVWMVGVRGYIGPKNHYPTRYALCPLLFPTVPNKGAEMKNHLRR